MRFGIPTFILLIALLFVSTLPACSGGGDNGMPSIAVDPQRIDFGDQQFGASLTFTVKVTNTGSGALRFKENPYIEVVEGC